MQAVMLQPIRLGQASNIGVIPLIVAELLFLELSELIGRYKGFYHFWASAAGVSNTSRKPSLLILLDFHRIIRFAGIIEADLDFR